MTRRKILAVLVAGLSLSALPGPARPDSEAPDNDRARDALRAGRVLPLSSIIAAVLNGRSGRVVDADLVESHGQLLYRLRIIWADGRIEYLWADAATGQQWARPPARERDHENSDH